MTEEQLAVFNKQVVLARLKVKHLSNEDTRRIHPDALLAADAELKRLEGQVIELESRSTQASSMLAVIAKDRDDAIAKANRLEGELSILKPYNTRLQESIIAAHVKALPENWEYCGPLETIDLMVAEIFTTRKECNDAMAEVAELRRDKDRLDWLDAHVPGRNQEVQARVCGYEEEYLGKDYTHREAIDEAMGGAK